ncbi:type II toxin-antitoxin system RelE/ParE family toxin [Rhizobium sp. SL42]|uniref:type II toxin-antitoxin system RelE/ParE family toxin n=1 Tax=Rhizobium sp. SL42 TaxID=2806346 RepID=UPI001F2EA542|nr:type II toxin-antitoxin system RelE/ParE family toxin [Rhizobium sp. SL42]UJW73189.1 type II toxin-antitoxin system RelE/ParE family toxin [Rhizobium sp. SL42]
MQIFAQPQMASRKRQVRWSSKARKDLREIYRYIAKYNPAAAEQFAISLHSQMIKLALLGLTGSQSDAQSDIRIFVFRERRIYIRVTDTAISILRVVHGRQDQATIDFTDNEKD